MLLKIRTLKLFWLRVGFIFAGALLLLWTPLLNGYPLIYSDSGSYIYSGALMYVPPDRSIGYGVFLFRISLVRSLWAVVALQAFATSYLMFRVGEFLLNLIPAPLRLWIAFAIVSLTALTTTVSTFVGFISPDIFTSWLFMGGLLFIVSTHRFERVLTGGLIALAIWAHNSHLMLGVGIILLLSLGTIVLPRWRTRLAPRLIMLSALVALTLIGIVAINFYLRAGVTLSRGGTTILLNRFVASGVLTETLKTYCSEQHWVLCGYQARLSERHSQPDWFLWSADSPIGQVGWDKNEDEQRALIWHAFQCCAGRIATTSVEESWKQFWQAQSATHIVALGDEWNAVQAIRRFYPHEVDAFLQSVQQSARKVTVTLLPLDEGPSQFFFLSMLLALLAIFAARKESALAFTLGAALLLLVLNAALVGALNGASGRYQARVIWLVPYLTYIASASFIFQFAAQNRMRNHPI